jgi:hypothetical protein
MGTVTLSSTAEGAASPFGIYSTTLTIPYSSTQIVAFRCDTAHIGLYDTYPSGSDIVYEIVSDANDSTNSALTYYVFDQVSPTPASIGYGLEVYNGSGNVLFSSMQGIPINVRDTATISASTSSPTTWTEDSGRNYAMVFSGRVATCGSPYTEAGPHCTTRTYVNETFWVFKNLGGAVQGMSTVIQRGAGEAYLCATTALVIDVTNL